MLKYLKILSWLLLTFGVVGFITVFLGLKPGIGSTSAALGLMGFQVMLASAILYGFKLHNRGKVSSRVLLYGGWALVVCLAVIGQVCINVFDINI